MDPAGCWNTADLFATDEAWQAEFDASQSLTTQAAAYQGRLGESAQTLYDYLTWLEQTNTRVEKLFCYAFLRNDEDTANPTYQAMKGRCYTFVVALGSATAFEGPELVAIPDETLDRFYREKPELETYRRYLTRARPGPGAHPVPGGGEPVGRRRRRGPGPQRASSTPLTTPI